MKRISSSTPEYQCISIKCEKIKFTEKAHCIRMPEHGRDSGDFSIVSPLRHKAYFTVIGWAQVLNNNWQFRLNALYITESDTSVQSSHLASFTIIIITLR